MKRHQLYQQPSFSRRHLKELYKQYAAIEGTTGDRVIKTKEF